MYHFIFPMMFLGYMDLYQPGLMLPSSWCSMFYWSVWSMKTTKELPPIREEIAIIEKYNEGKPNKFFLVYGYMISVSVVPGILYFLFNRLAGMTIANFMILPLFFAWIFLLARLLEQNQHITAIKCHIPVSSTPIETIDSIKTMPRVMWQLALVYLFQWYALFVIGKKFKKYCTFSMG
ncbi:MAG: hypothetical protein IPL08_10405 [Saprospiraceae bacterium]|nr:hypothetical protein [Saprospiraceae bacterium]